MNKVFEQIPGNHLINEPKVVAAVLVEGGMENTADESDDDAKSKRDEFVLNA